MASMILLSPQVEEELHFNARSLTLFLTTKVNLYSQWSINIDIFKSIMCFVIFNLSPSYMIQEYLILTSARK